MTLMPSQLQTLDICMKGCFLFNGFVLPSRYIRFAASPLKELRSLTIRYTECADELFARLSRCDHLQELILHHCSHVSSDGLAKLAEGTPELNSVELRYCACLCYILPVFVRNISTQFTRLASLKFLITNQTSTHHQISTKSKTSLFFLQIFF